MSYADFKKKSRAQLIDLIECLIKATQTDKKNYYAKIESVNRSIAQYRESTAVLLTDTATLRDTLIETQKIIATLQENLSFEKTIVAELKSIIMTYREKSVKDCLEKMREDSKLP